MTDKIGRDGTGNGENSLRELAENQLGKVLDVAQELKSIQIEQEQSRDSYQELYDFSPVGYFTLTEKGLIIQANLTGAALLGAPRSKLINLGFGHFVAPESVDQYHQHILNVRKQEAKQACDLTLKSEDGSSFYARLESIQTDAPVQAQKVNGPTHAIRMAVIDITDRKETEDAVRESQENLRSLFETMDDIIVVSDIDGKIMYFNPAVTQKLGYPPDELMTMRVSDLNPKSQRQEAERIFHEMLEGKQDTCPLPLERKDGTLIPVETRVWFGKWSGMDCVFGISKNLSKEQEALQKFNRLFELNPTPMAVTSLPDRTFLDINKSFLATLGFSRDEVIGRTSAELGIFVDSETQREIAQKLQTEGEVSNIELRFRRKDGAVLYGIFSGTTIHSQGQKYFLTAVLDITKRKRVEEELAQRQAILQGLLESIPDMIFFKDINGVYLGCNAEFNSFVGSESQDIIGHTDYDLFNKDVADFFRENDHIMMKHEVARHNEEWIDYPDGRRRLLDTFKAPLRLPNGELIGLLGVSRDITESRNAQKALQESEQRYRSLFEGSRDGIVFSDMEGQIKAFNTTYREILGYTAEELGGKTYYDITPIQWVSFEDKIVSEQIIPRGFSDTYEKEYICKDGRAIPVELNSFIVEKDGVNVGMWAIVRDITERKRLEEERLEMERKLLHAQKLESLGAMAGGIAHDFNNLLQVVFGNLELALNDLPTDSKIKKFINNAIQASERSAELSRQMLTYAGSAAYIPKNIHLNELLNTNQDLLKMCVSDKIKLKIVMGATLPLIKGNADQIQTAIINLLTNSSEAIGDKQGDVSLSIGVMEYDERFLRHSRLETKPEPGRFIFLEVEDNGCGMDDKTLQRLFDPFFSTKFWGRGLGMAEVMGIVKGHHGAIMVDSKVGKGTTIRVLLPSLDKVQTPFVLVKEEVETQPSIPRSPTGRKTILVVDDEEMVRELAAEWLELLGYETLTASDGAEAVRVFRERPNEIDLVLLDFAMPKMNGVEAFNELTSIRPDVKVILGSGYTEDVVMESFPAQHPDCILHKPYDMEKLKGELERLLGTAG